MSKLYSAWGNAPTDGPKGKYCAALGHRQDDESGLVYMRARYYDPVSGRFLSQDPSRKGENWFAYGGNNPIGSGDRSGQSDESEALAMRGSIYYLLGIAIMLTSAACGIFAKVTDIRSAWQSLVDQSDFLSRYGMNPNRSDVLDMIQRTLLKLDFKSYHNKIAIGGFVGAYEGYMLMIQGQLDMTDAEFLDPSSANEGVFKYF